MAIETSAAAEAADRRQREATPPAWIVATAFLVLVIVLRVSTFFHTVENWDESLHLLIARSILDGHPPYTAIWDHKPPGIHFLFALGQVVFGRSVLTLRILAVLAVTTSCVLLFGIGRSLWNREAGFVAALLYSVYSLGDGGLASNLEIFFAPFVLFGFHLVCLGGAEALLESRVRPLLLGLSAALAVEIKFQAAFDFIALLLLVGIVWARAAKRPSAERVLRCLGWVLVGPVLVFGLTILYFALSGAVADFLYASFTANTRYVGNVTLDWGRLAWMMRLRIERSFPLWLCLLLAPAYACGVVRSLDPEGRRAIAALLLWAGFAFLAIVSTGRLFAHYFLQLLPPLCVLCALILMVTIAPRRVSDPGRAVLLLVLVLSGWLLKTAYNPMGDAAAIVYHRYVRGIPDWGDSTAAVAAYLRPRVREQDYLFVVDDEPILYYLLPVRAPTKYVFSPFLVDERWSGVAPVDPAAELHAIFDREPVYVVKRKGRSSRFSGLVRNELDRSYRLEQVIGEVEIYRRRDSDRSGRAPLEGREPPHVARKTIVRVERG